jgi:hypothetical protein
LPPAFTMLAKTLSDGVFGSNTANIVPLASGVKAPARMMAAIAMSQSAMTEAKNVSANLCDG